MLTTNHKIKYDFTMKDPVMINEFKYKSGEVDVDGIDVEALNVTMPVGTNVMTNWVFEGAGEYLFVPVVGEVIDENNLRIWPPQKVLKEGAVAFEIILTDENGWLMKGPTATIRVTKSLILNDENNQDLDVLIQLLNETHSLKNAVITLNERMVEAETLREARVDESIEDMDAALESSRVATELSVKATEEANVVIDEIREIIDSGVGGGETVINDETYSERRTWSSFKIAETTLENTGAEIQEISGAPAVINNSPNHFLEDIEIFGKTTQDPDTLELTHLGRYNESTGKYELDIKSIGADVFEMTIELPCQLKSAGNYADRLYYDKTAKRYVIEKNMYATTITKESIASSHLTGSVTSINIDKNQFDPPLVYDDIKDYYQKPNKIAHKIEAPAQVNQYSSRPSTVSLNVYSSGTVRFYTHKASDGSFAQWSNQQLRDLIGDGLEVLLPAITPERIPTDYLEKWVIPTFYGTTRIEVSDGVTVTNVKVKVRQLTTLLNLNSLMNKTENLEQQDLELLQVTWSMDDRIYELEWFIEDNMSGEATKLSLHNPAKFEQAKALIEAGAYERDIMQPQLEKYAKRGIITQEECDILIAMMDEREPEGELQDAIE